jgi:hypothetical protein
MREEAELEKMREKPRREKVKQERGMIMSTWIN